MTDAPSRKFTDKGLRNPLFVIYIGRSRKKLQGIDQIAEKNDSSVFRGGVGEH